MISVSNQPTSNFPKWSSTGILSKHTAPQFRYDSDSAFLKVKLVMRIPILSSMERPKSHTLHPVWVIRTLSVCHYLFYSCLETSNYTFEQADRHPSQDILMKKQRVLASQTVSKPWREPVLNTQGCSYLLPLTKYGSKWWLSQIHFLVLNSSPMWACTLNVQV